MSSAPRPLVVGHRGAPGYRPEHSISGYRLALTQGADAVEPDVVASRDGVLVLRHENELSGTTDIAERPEFADRRTTVHMEGRFVTGWFTEHFDWAELQTLSCRERIPNVRSGSARFDDVDRLLRLDDLLDLLEEHREETGRTTALVLEVKHADYFESIGLPLDELIAERLHARGWADDPRLIVESFEKTVLGQLQRRGIRASWVYLIHKEGVADDEIAQRGSAAPTFPEELERMPQLAALVDGISVDKKMLTKRKHAGGLADRVDAEERRVDTGGEPEAVREHPLIASAHSAGLLVYTWTFRPERRFLASRFRGHGDLDDRGSWRREFNWLVSAGVDGIFVDHPDLALQARAALMPAVV